MRLYHYNNHPVKWVKVIGIVVAVDDWAPGFGNAYGSTFGRKVYMVDDGSGVGVECSCIVLTPPSNVDVAGAEPHKNLNYEKDKGKAKESVTVTGGNKDGKETPPEGVGNPKVPWDDIDVGTVVKVKGRIGAFRKIKQVDVVRIEIIRGLDQEVKFWDEARVFKRDILDQVWVLDEKEVERLKRRSEKLLRRERRKRDGNRQKEHGKHLKQGEKDITLRVRESEAKRRTTESDSNRKRSENERVQQEEIAKRRKAWSDKQEGLSKKNTVNYPSLAVRRAAAGRYEALGI